MNSGVVTPEDGSVDERVDVEQEMQSDSVFCHDVDSSVTESPGAYLLECGKVILLSRSEGYCFVEKLVQILQRAEFDFSTFCEELKLLSIIIRLYPDKAMEV